LLVGLPFGNALFAEQLGVVSVHMSLNWIDQDFVNDAHSRGLLVFVFTVNEHSDIKRMHGLGVDGVFSDFPDRVLMF
jgi:glycerophosphoryl diester phosphodiesterase